METSFPFAVVPGASAPGPRLPEPAQVTVHREPVVALDGRVTGYTVAVGVAMTTAAAAGDLHRQAAVTQPVPPVPPEVLHAEYMKLDLPNLVADRYVFVPATPAMLDGHVPEAVVPGRLVLDLPQRFEFTPDAVARAAALRGLGMQLALLDYRGEPEQEALLGHVGYVVVDPNLPNLPLAALVHHVHSRGARVLATGVASMLVEDECRAAGVDALRGGGAPTSAGGGTGSGAGSGAGAGAAGSAGVGGGSGAGADGSTGPGATRVLRAGELQCLALLHLLSQPDVDLGAVSQVIDTDPVLTLRVLHLVNSGAFALQTSIDTVHQAVVLLGVREVTTLVTALMLDARPDAMDSLWFILARSLTCEDLANDQAGYTVGMLSALSEQLGVPTDVVLEKVGVSDAVADAVRSDAGALGSVLAAVRAHERKDAAGVLATGLLPGDVSNVYVRCLTDALATARTVTRDPGF